MQLAVASLCQEGEDATDKQRGGDMEEQTKKPDSEMRLAAKYGQIEVITDLLSQGVPVDSTDSRSWTALMLAAKYGQKSTVRFLLDFGADFDTDKESGRAVLGLAVSSGKPEVVQILLDTINHIHPDFCIRSGNPQIVQLLLDAGASVNPEEGGYFTPLYYAVQSKSRETAKLLLDAGARFDYRGDNGRRLLAEVKNGFNPDPDMIALLRAYGFSDSEEDTQSRWTITEPLERECRLSINPDPPFWCAYDVEVWPAPECDSIEFELAAAANADTIKWFPHLVRGIQQGRENAREWGEEWVGIHIVVLRIHTHPIATTQEGCEFYGRRFFQFIKSVATRLPD